MKGPQVFRNGLTLRRSVAAQGRVDRLDSGGYRISIFGGNPELRQFVFGLGVPRNRESHHCVRSGFSRPSTSTVDFPGCPDAAREAAREIS